MTKLILLTAIVFLNTIVFADEIDDIVSKIKKERDINLPKEQLVNIDSPMPKLIVVDKNSSDKNRTTYKEKEIVLKLKGIVNNKANINGEWVKIGEEVAGYKLVDIMDDSVYLVDGNRSKMLFFEKNSSKIKIIFR